MNFYACDGSFVSCYHDRDGESVHEVCAEGDQLCFWLGWIMMPITAIPMLFVVGKSDNAVGTVGGIVCVVELVVLIFAIVPTERALKKTFDKTGNRKTE